jgi:hypothetical protein
MGCNAGGTGEGGRDRSVQTRRKYGEQNEQYQERLQPADELGALDVKRTETSGQSELRTTSQD